MSAVRAHLARARCVRAVVLAFVGALLIAALLPGTAPRYGWTLPALATIVREEGFTALYKGYVPKVLRLGPGGGILLVVYDQVSALMRKYLQ